MTTPGDRLDRRTRAFRLEEFRDFLSFERGLSARTVDGYTRDLSRFVDAASSAGASGPEDVNYDILRGHVADLADLGRAPATISRAISSLRGYFRFLNEEGILQTDPTELLEAPRAGRPLPDVLSVAEILTVLDAITPDRAAAFRDRAILDRLPAVAGELLPDARLDAAREIVRVVGRV